jgi:hypothetical protein
MSRRMGAQRTRGRRVAHRVPRSSQSMRIATMSIRVDSGITSSSPCPLCSWCFEDSVSSPAIGISFVIRADEPRSTSRRFDSEYEAREHPRTQCRNARRTCQADPCPLRALHAS